MEETIQNLSNDALIDFYASLMKITNMWEVFKSKYPNQTSQINGNIKLKDIEFARSELEDRGIFMTGENLSVRQKRIMFFIQKYISSTGRAPSVAEIQAGVLDNNGKPISSTSVVKWNLDRLEKLGYIEKTPRTARSIKVTNPI